VEVRMDGGRLKGCGGEDGRVGSGAKRENGGIKGGGEAGEAEGGGGG